MRLLMVSIDRGILDQESDVYQRMLDYAKMAEEIHIIVLCDQNQIITSRNGDGLFLYPTESKNKYFYILDAIRMGRKIEGVDLITAQDPHETGIIGYILKKFLRKPLQIQEHGDVYGQPFWRAESSENNFKYKLGIFVLKRADCIRVVADRIKINLVKKFKIDAAKIDVLEVRTDIAKFANAKPNLDVHDLYPGHDNIILTMARLVKQKNLPLLINSFANVLEDHPKSLLLIVGEGDQEAHLKSLVLRRRISDNVIFLPWTEDVVSYMKTADVFALSSNYEGWGRTLIEAMASKIPIVTTDVGCVGQVLVHGQDGIVVKPNDEHAYTQALLRAMTDKALTRHLSEHGFQKVHTLQNQFSHHRKMMQGWEKCAS